ncbi:CBS domain-containing protein [Paenibacillus sp. MMS20-IR301]|uniref:CBS domain-containing protein n=1 Tax=Paenibacillus sp. MMS20-IR301 TaxID=2895946 RepID=UPI0028EBC542|nr:CBS domain-containing protein [Paenibacillus sp. MMS20-IR301]WNS42698.1 CBS domain-containing protein [Paenibacillus sp. MMS20-IR301]
MTITSTAGLSAILRQAPAISPSLTCREALRVQFQHPESKCIVVRSSSNEPVGLIMCERFFLKATGRMGIDQFYNEPVSKLMNRSPLTADISASPESLWAEAMQRPEAMRQDCIIVTDNGRIAGILHPAELLR